MKRLVVTGDDFGLSSGVVAGVGAAHNDGILTSASLMVNAPAAGEAFRLAVQRPSLAVGLHLVLTFGRPVGPAKAVARLLKADGTFHRLEAGAHRSIPPEGVKNEIEAQVHLFTRQMGRFPSHLDGHHHVHVLPGVLEGVIKMARDMDIPVRAPDETTRERLRAAGVKTTSAFLDSFYGEGNIEPARLIGILEDSLPDGTTELMCHPAIKDPKLVKLSGYTWERSAELTSLTSAAVRKAIDRLHIHLIPSTALG